MGGKIAEHGGVDQLVIDLLNTQGVTCSNLV